MISVWLRVIRVRFLLASIIAVSVGLAITWWHTGNISIFDAILTMCGVLALHASVDLLNDYWDFKRGIDTTTHRTKMSGGSGVLPEGLLKPAQVYAAGIAFLIIGTAIGIYFIATDGVVIGIILAFAVISIYFYSTKIVDWGLAEVFVAIKGSMIVMGTYFVQTSQITEQSVLAGIVIGVLSSLVLFITSFPDHDADKAKGRKTLVISLGMQKACSILWIFPAITYGITIIAVVFEIFPVFCLIILSTVPLIIKSGQKLKQNYDKLTNLIPVMSSTLYFSRITGALLVVGFLVNIG
ncbi:prenyltransferase [Marine Group I thaumarchaeote]|uniref:Prenyltransferase n=1 Tax=Marine Group I thaumarchaeote TaxID=2511932 RepID=A0A7K4N340_9ARCH|nr:prenyltransferase [Marine Group I thaumarchaeote]